MKERGVGENFAIQSQRYCFDQCMQRNFKSSVAVSFWHLKIQILNQAIKRYVSFDQGEK